jgi:hypothetical protein
MRTRYLLLVFGDGDSHYQQAHHAILSLLAFAPEPREIVVVSDRPERFAWLAPVITLETVDAATLTAWRGTSGFFWRIKLHALLAHADPDQCLVYLDSDVLVRRDLGPLLAHLAGGGAAMHLREFNLAARRRRGDRALYAAAGGKRWGGLPIDAGSWMWNAGVVAVGPTGKPLLAQALQACDELCAALGIHSLHEQLSLSLALASGGKLTAAQPWIDHYWDNKPGYLESITSEQARFLMTGATPAAAAAWVRDHPIERPLSVRQAWWQKRLVARLAPKR